MQRPEYGAPSSGGAFWILERILPQPPSQHFGIRSCHECGPWAGLRAGRVLNHLDSGPHGSPSPTLSQVLLLIPSLALGSGLCVCVRVLVRDASSLSLEEWMTVPLPSLPGMRAWCFLSTLGTVVSPAGAQSNLQQGQTAGL